MHDTEDPTRSSAADAAGMAADYSARHTYARGYEDGRKARPLGIGEAEYLAAKDDALQLRRARDAEKARADAAERRVAELRAAVEYAREHVGYVDVRERLDAALSSTADIAGRWCPVAERDAAIADRNRACDALEAAERARDEVGIQLAAAQAEIARMRPVVEACRTAVVKWRAGEPYDLGHYMVSASAVLDALDTVPGDALAPKGVE